MSKKYTFTFSTQKSTRVVEYQGIISNHFSFRNHSETSSALRTWSNAFIYVLYTWFLDSDCVCLLDASV